MIRLIAQYRIKEGSLDKVQAAIQKFVTSVEREEPETRYEAYQLTDSNEFLHIMAFPNESAQEKHQNALYTIEFVEILYPNCIEEPKFTPVSIIK
ncbi:MAG: antibiotic biosynthesis monooxygenase [Balneolales bacterium]